MCFSLVQLTRKIGICNSPTIALYIHSGSQLSRDDGLLDIIQNGMVDFGGEIQNSMLWCSALQLTFGLYIQRDIHADNRLVGRTVRRPFSISEHSFIHFS